MHLPLCFTCGTAATTCQLVHDPVAACQTLPSRCLPNAAIPAVSKPLAIYVCRTISGLLGLLALACCCGPSAASAWRRAFPAPAAVLGASVHCHVLAKCETIVAGHLAHHHLHSMHRTRSNLAWLTYQHRPAYEACCEHQPTSVKKVSTRDGCLHRVNPAGS